jgi:hypothetical protein
METTIFKTIKGLRMEMLFDAQLENINIKSYNAINISDKDYSCKETYKFEIRIRHAEGTIASDEFDKALCKMFPTKKERLPKKKIFLVSTEFGRIKGKVSFYIAEIVPNKGLRLIDNFYTCSRTSNSGIENEAVKALVKAKELPLNAIATNGYRNHKIINYSLILVEGRGLNYINQIN